MNYILSNPKYQIDKKNKIEILKSFTKLAKTLIV